MIANRKVYLVHLCKTKSIVVFGLKFFLVSEKWLILEDFCLQNRGFKALKQTVKLYFRLGKYKEMMEAYREMLTYIKSAVTRNYSEKCINNIMDFVSGTASQNFDLLQEFYQTTLKALEEAKNEVKFFYPVNVCNFCFVLVQPTYLDWYIMPQRLWFKTNLKLCKICFDIGEYGRMNKVSLTYDWYFVLLLIYLIWFNEVECGFHSVFLLQILKELHKSCRKEDGSDDQKKGSQLLEVYALEIQMYTETKNNKKLKVIFSAKAAVFWILSGQSSWALF